MPTTLKSAVQKYLGSTNPARGTRAEYSTTLKKWREWGGGVPIERIGRKEIREFLDWVYDRALANKGTNPGRTANKAREHLRAVISWAWEQDIIETPPRFPKAVPQRDVAGLALVFEQICDQKAVRNSLQGPLHLLDDFTVVTAFDRFGRRVSDVLQLPKLAGPLSVRQLPRRMRVHHRGTIEGKLLEASFLCATVTLFVTKGPKRFNDVADPMIFT